MLPSQEPSVWILGQGHSSAGRLVTCLQERKRCTPDAWLWRTSKTKRASIVMIRAGAFVAVHHRLWRLCSPQTGIECSRILLRSCQACRLLRSDRARDDGLDTELFFDPLVCSNVALTVPNASSEPSIALLSLLSGSVKRTSRSIGKCWIVIRVLSPCPGSSQKVVV